MSRFSGKCDLFDHMCMEKHRTKDGSDDPKDLKKASILYSDPVECFEIFKKKTGGILHQHKKINEVTIWNQDFIASHNPAFKIIKHTKNVPDGRKRSGSREEISYTYEYWGKTYTAKELSKKGVYITIDIHFETLLDLIPYFPYIISSCACSEDKETIYISSRSFVEEEADESLQYGHERDTYYYRHELAEFYKEYILEYYGKKEGQWLQ